MGSTGGGGHFGQNGQKLHENDKIGIFGSKQSGGHGRGEANFSGSGGDPPSPPPLGETLSGEITLQTTTIIPPLPQCLRP